MRRTERAFHGAATERTRPMHQAKKPAPPVTIRPFQAADASALAAIYVAALEQLARDAYTPDQLRVWRAHAPSPATIRQAYGDGRVALVARFEDEARATGIEQMFAEASRVGAAGV